MTLVAQVVASYGRHLLVEGEGGDRTLCQERGRRQEAVVGDWVELATTGDGAVIDRVIQRRNLMLRQDERRSKAFASNLDALLVIVAVEPVFNESLLARALVAAHSAAIDCSVILNKIDLAGAAPARERLEPYARMGQRIVELSLKRDPEGARLLLRPLLQGRTTLLLGASGMGKSTMINLLVPGAQAQTAEISRALRSGRHTTTSTTLYRLGGAEDGAVIDSPGFQTFGLHHLRKEDLAAAMPDLAAHLGRCRFSDCSHLHEPDCGLSAAVASGAIAASRWRIYTAMYQELQDRPAARGR